MTSFHFENASISNSKAPRSSKKKTRVPKDALVIDSRFEGRLNHFFEKGDNWIEITMPIITVSEANGGLKIPYKRNGKTCYKSEHWTDKHRRHRIQKGTVALLLRPHRKFLSMPCNITLTRYAPDKLDRFDNLPMSLKWILDSVCEIITGDTRPGHADSHEGIVDVKYLQVQTKEYGVKVRVEIY